MLAEFGNINLKFHSRFCKSLMVDYLLYLRGHVLVCMIQSLFIHKQSTNQHGKLFTFSFNKSNMTQIKDGCCLCEM